MTETQTETAKGLVIEHGSMDIAAHEKTFEGFVKFASYMVMGIIALLIFLALVGA